MTPPKFSRPELPDHPTAAGAKRLLTTGDLDRVAAGEDLGPDDFGAPKYRGPDDFGAMAPKYGGPPPSNNQIMVGWAVRVVPDCARVSLFPSHFSGNPTVLGPGDEMPFDFWEVDLDGRLSLRVNAVVAQQRIGSVLFPPGPVTRAFVQITRPNDGKNYPMIAPPSLRDLPVYRQAPKGFVYHIFADLFVQLPLE